MNHVFMTRNPFEREISDRPNIVAYRVSIVLKAILDRFTLPAIQAGDSFARPRTIEPAGAETRDDSAID
jgi:hypothetical protein